MKRLSKSEERDQCQSEFMWKVYNPHQEMLREIKI